MAMVDMKRSKKERKEANEPTKLGGPGGDDYPYGLHVHLDHESLEKLGMDKLPRVGQKLHLHAHAHVTEVSEEHRDGGKKHRRVALQLRKLDVKDAGSESAREAATAKGAKGAMDAALEATNEVNSED